METVKACVNCKYGRCYISVAATRDDPGTEEEVECINENLPEDFEYPNPYTDCCELYESVIVDVCDMCMRPMNVYIDDPSIFWAMNNAIGVEVPTCSELCKKRMKVRSQEYVQEWCRSVAAKKDKGDKK